MPTPAHIVAGDISQRETKKSELFRRAGELLSAHGVCVIRNAFDADVITALRAAAQQRMYEVQRLLLLHGMLSQNGSVDVRFKEVVERDGGRCDMRLKMDEEPFRSIKSNSLLLELGRSLLGDEMIEQFFGIVTALGRKSLPYCDLTSSGSQQWHQDGGQLFENSSGPAPPLHCVNLFFPLVDIAERSGATEFLLGSHTSFGFDPTIQQRIRDSEQVVLDEKAGSIVLFDYRTWHRGGEHLGIDDRHVLYLTLSKPWFVDHKNHRSTRSIYDTSVAVAGSLKRKKPSKTHVVETFDGVDLWPARSATVEALAWKREGRSAQERYDSKYEYSFDTMPRKFDVMQSREGICSTVWDASIVLAKYFEVHPELVQDKRCLGLGSGCGLTEVVASFLGAKSVCATDLKAAIPLLSRNLDVSPLDDMSALELQWGEAESIEKVKKLGPFDVIIGADIVYVEASGAALVETIESLMGTTSRVCFAYGRNRQHLKDFLVAAKSRGITFTQVPIEEHHKQYRSADIDIVWGTRTGFNGTT